MKRKIVSSCAFPISVYHIIDFIGEHDMLNEDFERYFGVTLEDFTFTDEHINDMIDWLSEHQTAFDDFCRHYGCSEDEVFDLQV